MLAGCFALPAVEKTIDRRRLAPDSLIYPVPSTLPIFWMQRVLLPVSEVADMQTRLGPARRYVDPVFQHSRHDYVAFICDGESWFRRVCWDDC